MLNSFSLLDALTLLLASAAAGAVNSVAGGGTLLTFPTLIGLGLPPIIANFTSTIGLTPGGLGAIWGYRREVKAARAWIPWVVPSSLLGGVFGALLLTRTPPPVFERLAPLLVLSATVLFILQEPIARRLRLGRDGKPASTGAKIAVAALQVLVATYGGYFGAGMGILILASLGMLNLPSIHSMNGVKTMATAAINIVATVYFLFTVSIVWPAVLIMVVGSLLGGYFGADGARRLGQRTVRGIVIAIGLLATIALAIQQ